MASRLGHLLLKAKPKVQTTGYLLFLRAIFSSAVWLPMANFGYYHRNSLTHSMLITAFGLSIFGPKVTGSGWVSIPN